MFKNFFGNKLKLTTRSLEPLEENLKLSLDDNTVVFAVDKENQLIIKLSIQNLETESAYKFAEVLFLTTRSAYRKEIVEMMQSMAVEDPTRAEFISETIMYWAKMLDKYDKEEYYNDGPLISPSKFCQLVINNESK